MVPTAIPAMTPGDKLGRAVVTGDKCEAVGREIDNTILVYPTCMKTA